MDAIIKCVLLIMNAVLFYAVGVNSSTPAATTTTPFVEVTTLASHLDLHDKILILILAGSILIGGPCLVIIVCGIRSCIAHKREKKIKGLNEFAHPPPSQPPSRPFLQRDNTIQGPFRNPAFREDDDDEDNRSETVTPSFISTRVVDEPGFGIKPQQRYQYIP